MDDDVKMNIYNEMCALKLHIPAINLINYAEVVYLLMWVLSNKD